VTNNAIQLPISDTSLLSFKAQLGTYTVA